MGRTSIVHVLNLDIAGKKQEMIDIFQLDRPYRKCHMNEIGRTKSKIILWLDVSLFFLQPQEC